MSVIRKGEIFALERTHTTVYANFAKSESHKTLTLEECMAASKAGIVQKYRSGKDYPALQLKYLAGKFEVFAIPPGDYQKAARRLFDAQPPFVEYSSAENLRQAITRGLT